MANRLNPGERLLVGRRLVSSNGRYTLELQEDGNLVLFAAGRQTLWDSKTSGQPVQFLIMQEDGNLVIIGPGNVPVWASKTDGHPGSVVILQDDRNLVIYAPGNNDIWSTKTALPSPPPPVNWQATEEFRCAISDWEGAIGIGDTRQEAIQDMVEDEENICAMLSSHVQERRNRTVTQSADDAAQPQEANKRESAPNEEDKK